MKPFTPRMQSFFISVSERDRPWAEASHELLRIERRAVEVAFQDLQAEAVGAVRQEVAPGSMDPRGRTVAVGPGDPRPKDAHALSRDGGERTGIGRRDRAHQVVDLARAFRPVDAPVLRLAPAEVAALREVLRTRSRGAVEDRGK